MSEATATLVGVVVGAGMTGLVTFLREWRRELKDKRAAKRVIRRELKEAAEAVRDTKAAGRWPPGWVKTWSQSWAMYRPILAAAMRADAFDTVATAYLYMGQLETSLAAGKRYFVAHDELFLGKVEAALEAAMDAISKPPWYRGSVARGSQVS